MTSTDLLGQLRREWQRVGRDPASRRAFATLRARHDDLGLEGLDDLFDVVLALELRGGRCVLERARIVQALLQEAHDAAIRRALLQTLLPGIVSVCRQLRFGDGIIDDPSETVAMAVALCCELLVDWAGQSRQFAAPDLLSALRGRLRRWLLKEKAALRATAGEVRDVASEPDVDLATRLALLSHGADERLARLTYDRVFRGVALGVLARREHAAPATLQRELQVFALEKLL